jgi:lipopolysaccharide/colanic/teichoic acid biosynthesis glycosyltransferase
MMDRTRNIHSSETLRRILERERARTDRTGLQFSFVEVDPIPDGPVDAGDLEPLADILSRRIRATDVVGMFGERSLGVILHATPVEGAWEFVNNVRREITNGGREPLCKVYTYPTSWGSFGQTTGDPPTGSSEAGGRPVPSGPENPPGNGNGEKTFHRMEEIFGSPLPAWKRTLDVMIASVGLTLLSPLFLLIATAIRIVSPGPAFFRQKRVGHRGNLFNLWKFRTMHPGNEDAVHRHHLQELIRGSQPMAKLDSGGDTRIIPFGKILRRACIDELPQLLNVLKGDMTLVGPRPCLPYEAEEFLPWHSRRFDSVPGLTGLWQVSGKNRTTFKEMIRLDIAYSRTISPWLDIKIMAKTLPWICTQVAGHFEESKKVRQDSTNTGGEPGKNPVRRAE